MANNRSELHYEITPAVANYELPIKTISGVDLRYQSLVSYQDFGVEPFFLYDCTQPPSQFRFPPHPLAGSRWGTCVNVGGVAKKWGQCRLKCVVEGRF